MNGQLWWYVARSAGITAWVLATVSVALGTMMGAVLVRKPGRAWQLDLHRFLGAATVVFVGIHVVAIVADTFVSFGWVDVFLPLQSTWHPVAVAWGIVAMWLLVAVEATSLIRDRMPRRIWHGIHLLSYPVFVLATIHGLAAGTDARGDMVAWLALSASGVVVSLLVARLFESDRRVERVELARARARARGAVRRTPVAARARHWDDVGPRP